VGLLRIHFTSNDLAKTTVATATDPLWEIVLSRFRLRERHPALPFQPWRGAVRDNRDGLARMRTGDRMLTVLAPYGPYFPDFLTPPEGHQGLEPGLDAVMSTPRARLHDELCRLARHAVLPGWVRPLADGDTAALGQLRTALLDYHDVVIAPYRDLIQGCVDADRARRAHAFLKAGIDGLFASLPSALRWQPPVLEINYVQNQELHLHGRGLHLIPSYFCYETAVSFADPGLTPVLIYPVERDLRWTAGAAADRRSLEALLGRTRTAVLYATDPGVTTTQLSRLLDISLSSASRHSTVLRDAGLIATHRCGSAVLHTLTALGRQLIQPR
jgi:DNA-binding transcriptional ArsR family regulator